MPRAFDVAVNLYNSFGYFADPEGDRLLVKNAFHSLKEGGTLFIETQGKELAARDFTGSEWFRRAGYIVFTEYQALDSWAALKNTWRLVPEQGGAVIEKAFTHRLYAASELRALLLDTGFERVQVYGDWDERPYDHRAVKLIAAGRKAAPPVPA
jgi:SAM-dependent methyltransferase